jgi:hypothetical protein
MTAEDSTATRCVMTRTEPFDFAQCQTHDTTFALGEECKFNGKDVADVLQDEADEQRQAKVRAQHELEQSRLLVGAYLATWGGSIPEAWLSALTQYADEVPLEHALPILEAHLAATSPAKTGTDHG